jgi:hypothetical protein
LVGVPESPLLPDRFKGTRAFRLASAAVLAVCVSAASSLARAQDRAEPPDSGAPPDVYTRDANGHITVRAVRLREPLAIDGRLDEEIYRQVPHLGPFIQQEPNEGAEATEATDVWIFFDDRNLYVSARCWDSQAERIVANELRRDHINIFQNDNFGFSLDTFHDQRSGFFFNTNAVGGLRDLEIIDERGGNIDWNGVWDVRARRFDKGWDAEFAIPFKTLRYRGTGAQTWGLILRRIIRWKNESQYLTPIPSSYGTSGIYKFSSGATLVGLEAPDDRPVVEVKPYGIAAMTDRRTGSSIGRNETGDVGIDLKYGLSKGLTADFTYNTDFAQVEADEQQINLTRFSLFFPEKRDFFLESQGVFQFGNPRARGITGQAPSLSPLVFFSRRIGLNEGQRVPIVAGGRVTGRAGKYAIGALQIRTGDEPQAQATTTDFSAVRVRRDFLRRSTIGLIATNRSHGTAGPGASQVVGADAALAFHDNVLFSTYYAQSHTPGERRNQASYMTQFSYSPDRYGVNLEHLHVGEGFNPDVGFLPRQSFRRTYGAARFSPRPRASDLVRKYWYEASLDYITDTHNVLETRNAVATFRIDFNSSDGVDLEYTDQYELLRQPFRIVPALAIPAGSYRFQNLGLGYRLGPQRRLTGSFALGHGSFYDGTKTEAGYNGRLELTTRLAVEPRVTVNWIQLPAGDVTTKLASTRVTYALNARAAVSALLQYTSTSRTLASNVRFRWEYLPGSDLFVVYSDGRDTVTQAGIPRLQNRTVAIKATRLLRF